MATAKPVIHVFSEINEGKYKSVKHYELIDVKNGISQLTHLINISKDRNCAQSMPDYWLKEMNGKKWNSFCTTGLFKTGIENLYKGDKDHKKHLIVVKFSFDEKTLTAYFFKDYYTKDLSKVLQIINQ